MSDAKHTRTRTRTQPRPWYVRNSAVEEYKTALESGDNDDLDNPRMKRQLTVVRSIIVNLGIIGLAFYGLMLGGDVTWITIFALAVLAGYNGIELSELGAFLTAYREVQQSDD